MHVQIADLNAMLDNASVALRVLPTLGGVACLDLLLDMLRAGFE